MNKEIPMPLVKSNQVGVVLFIVLATIIQQPLLLLLLWIIQAVGLLFGTKASLFIQIAKPFLHKKIAGAETQAVELQRFNNSLGMTFLTISLLSFSLHWKVAGYLFANMFAVAALLSVCGFCIGCLIYFQYRQFKYRINRNR
ncbi:hypothetical protein QFZ81_003627 [Paenibacillus sp. V4I9]|uniref:DUF4395 domain-containing protein n=1 Tax=Paenibacillus sp. V4I9 TaxID=3042308 RepID=UPI00277D9BA7|nr:DUF4395 domain-containing protein [Paenibacillus sp. V4I9]MDQ0888539.1 hypothetical protein [Paenibacillus sp. V4I9]